jgi:hypothetical protein
LPIALCGRSSPSLAFSPRVVEAHEPVRICTRRGTMCGAAAAFN